MRCPCKRFLAWVRILFLPGVVGLLSGCAATAPPAGKTAEFEKGLKYSEWLYPQPIDILKNEPFSLPMPDVQKAPQKKPSQSVAARDTTVQPYAVQLGSFRIEAHARRFLRDIQQTHPGFKFEIRHSLGLWRVVVGFYGTHADAQTVRDILRQQGFPDAWIVHFE